MGWLNLRSLRNLFANRSTTRLLGMTERQFQEWVDLHRLYLALAYYDGRDDVHAEEDPTETLTEEAASKSVEELRSSVMDLARRQVEDMMADEKCSRGACSVRVDLSGIDGAGDGVWLDGVAQVGQVVALFPGLIYGPKQVRDIPGYPSFGSQSDFLMSRFDGYMIDSRAWMFHMDGNMEGYNAMRKRTVRSQEDAASQNGTQNFSEESLTNTWAVGHMVNHPTRDGSPNIMPVPVNWTTCDHRLDACLPWALFSSGNTLKGLAFVAKRHIEDEELFVDYRLNPGVMGGVPEWYHHVDQSEDVRRWS
ncbi:hypothetical protein M9434_004504 [Picochlorum sp. BPE23]|nr:hypothetical protein M9434_004504 [Picochlorum sp. BPE23]